MLLELQCKLICCRQSEGLGVLFKERRSGADRSAIATVACLFFNRMVCKSTLLPVLIISAIVIINFCIPDLVEEDSEHNHSRNLGRILWRKSEL